MVWVLLLASYVDNKVVIYDEVDCTEINRYYDNEAELVFVQIIFWDFNWLLDEYVCRDWRFVRDNLQEPVRVWGVQGSRPQWKTSWWDEKDNVRREVRSWGMRSTRTWWDPEVENRKLVPVWLRKGLSRGCRNN